MGKAASNFYWNGEARKLPTPVVLGTCELHRFNRSLEIRLPAHLCAVIYKTETVIGKRFLPNGPFSAFFNYFEMFNGPFLIILHRLLWAILKVNGTMAHGPCLPWNIVEYDEKQPKNKTNLKTDRCRGCHLKISYLNRALDDKSVWKHSKTVKHLTF